jgi:uncharacterized protein YkwD
MLLLCISQGAMAQVDTVKLSAEEKSLAEQINFYRRSKGLRPVKVSRSLTYVAKVHCADLGRYGSEIKRGCNMHSWSRHGKWTPVDYYEDHRNAAKMWSKPSELTAYTGEGYEIAYENDDNATAAGALAGWKTSSGHNAVILNAGAWRSLKWDCMGVCVLGSYSVVWFGESPDPGGYLK